MEPNKPDPDGSLLTYLRHLWGLTEPVYSGSSTHGVTGFMGLSISAFSSACTEVCTHGPVLREKVGETELRARTWPPFTRSKRCPHRATPCKHWPQAGGSKTSSYVWGFSGSSSSRQSSCMRGTEGPSDAM